MKTKVVSFGVYPHHADYLRGALSAVLEDRLLASTEAVCEDSRSGVKYSRVDITVAEQGIKDHEILNTLFIKAHRAVERLTGEEIPWEVSSKEMEVSQ